MKVGEAAAMTEKSIEAHDSINLDRMNPITHSSSLMLIVTLEELYLKHPDADSGLRNNDLVYRRDEEPRGNKAERKRLKQREHRQKWRSEKRKEKLEKEAPVLGSKLSADTPEQELYASDKDKLFSHVTSRRHRPTTHERNMSFANKLHESYAHQTDWAIVYGQTDKYPRFLYHRIDPPLLRLSVLVRKVEHAMKILGSRSFEDRYALEWLVHIQPSYLAFFREHLGL